MRGTNREAIVRAVQDLERPNGDLKPEDVIEAARDEASPLHNEFEWDLTKAAHHHWMDTARELIREVRIVFTVSNQTRQIKAYVHRPDAQPQESLYLSTAKVKQSPEQIRAALKADVSRIIGQLMNTVNLAEYWGVDAELLRSSLDNVETYKTLLEQDPSTLFLKRKRRA